MEASVKNRDDSHCMTDPDDKTDPLSVQFNDRTSIIDPCLVLSVHFVEKIFEGVKHLYDDTSIPQNSYHVGGDEAKNMLFGNGFA